MAARGSTLIPGGRADPAAGRRASARLVPPLLAWLAANAFYWAAAEHAGYDFFLVRTHARWDSGNYLKIARHGYTLAHCLPRAGSPFTAADWCGTVGWFPLYPLAMRLVGALGLGAPRAGLLLAELFALGSLGLVWWLLGASLRPATLTCLALAAVFPGSIYEHALFPVSLAVAAGLAFLGLLARRRWTAAGLAGPGPGPPTSPGSCSPPSPPSGCRSSGAGSASTRCPPSAGPSRPPP